MYRRIGEDWIKHIDFIALDVACLLLSLFVAIPLRNVLAGPIRVPIMYRGLALVLVIVDVLVFVLFNDLKSVLRRGYYREFIATLRHVTTVFVTVMMYMFQEQEGSEYSRFIIYMTMGIYLVLGYGFRILWKKVIFRRGAHYKRMCMLLLTKNDMAQEAIDGLHVNHFKNDTLLAGVILLDAESSQQTISGIPVIAGTERAAEYICREWVDEIFVYLPENSREADSLITKCQEMGVTVHVNLDVESRVGQKQFVEQIGKYTVLTSTMNYATFPQVIFKRTLDIIGGIIGSAAAVLIILIVGPVIYIQSPGPVIFKQTRIGKNGKRFTLYKIRSMYMDAEQRKKDLLKQNKINDSRMFKMDFDPRIIGNRILPDGQKKTGIGEFIRSWSLDEFPQFFNVLKGEMSLVGTRPPTVDEWEQYEFHHRARLAVKPGITGMWQVSGRSEITDFEEVVRLDTQYISEWDPGLDLMILLKTVAAVFKHRGAV